MSDNENVGTALSFCSDLITLLTGHLDGQAYFPFFFSEKASTDLKIFGVA